MPKIIIDGKPYESAAGKTLVKAIEESGVNIGHRCGGKSKCTSCKVIFKSGEPGTITKAEHERLTAKDLLGKARLSCQIIVTEGMDVTVLNTLESEGWADTGPELGNEVIPTAEWFDMDELD